MSFEPTIKELIDRCKEISIELDPVIVKNTLNKTPKTTKYSRWELTKKIVDVNLPIWYDNKIPSSAKFINAMESAMMCARITDMKEEDKELLLADNNEYYAERKFNGCRCRICYTPKEGFKFYSNNRDTDTLLFTEWTDKVLLIKDGEVKKPEDFKGISDSTFILDSEILVDTKHVDTSKYGGQGETESELNAITTILQLEPEDSKDVQLNQEKCQLKFYPFDIIYFNKNLMKEPLKNRNKIRDKVLEKLQNWGVPFYNTKRVYKDKKQYFETLVNSGGEGIILKNENEIYTPDKTRNKHRQIKMKRSISAMMGEDIDGFIIGFEPSDPTKGLKDYIGAIKIGTNLIKVDGSEEVHHIASISGMPLELRKKLTVKDSEGKPTLNPEYLGKCITFDGFDVKLRSMRFSHARVVDWNTAWRPDKDRHDCSIDEEILLQNVL